MSKYEKVTKKEFEYFVKNYPKNLEIDTAHFYDPPIQTYNDFSNGDFWPKSSVAYITLNYLFDEPYDYYIKNKRI